MKGNESVEFFMRVLNEQHAALKASMNEFYAAMGGINADARKAETRKALDAAKVLQNTLC